MVCDHVAWAALDFFTPLAQIMHIIGRLTIPIMCFFIAEGYRHTSNVKRYVLRLALFGTISIIPFYIFFHETFGYRCNIIFDLLFGLTALIITDSKKLKKPVKGLLCVLLFAFSLAFGGWPALPIVYILIFYYRKDFSSRTVMMCIATIVTIAIAVGLSLMKTRFGVGADWPWYEKFYLLGFVLAMIPLRMYDGTRGGDKNTGWFFYAFYPIHFIVLTLLFKADIVLSYGAYLSFHVLTLLLIIVLIIGTVRAKTSRPQVANVLFLSFALTFMLGFIIEITSQSLAVTCAATKIEYFAECGFILAYTWFIDEFCRIRLPKAVYIIEFIITAAVTGSVATIESNRLFYLDMALDRSRIIPKFVASPGIMFVVFYAYFAVVFLGALIVCFEKHAKSTGVDRKRIGFVIMGSLCPWAVMIPKALGLTDGYDFITVGIFGALVCLTYALIRYGYFNSVQAANDNALNHGIEGILVIDGNHRILFFNNIMKSLFPGLEIDADVYDIGTFKEVFEENTSTMNIGERIYEMRVEPLIECDYVQGYMLWAIEMTDHYKNLENIRSMAQTDSLTGLHNRSSFESAVQECLVHRRHGAMIMFDMDNFKQINDSFGHATGDKVLVAFSKTLTDTLGKDSISCRIGGDEFCSFAPDKTDRSRLDEMAMRVINSFHSSLCSDNLPDSATVSIGIAIYDGTAVTDFTTLYSNADKALYLSKNSGKNVCNFYEQSIRSV